MSKYITIIAAALFLLCQPAFAQRGKKAEDDKKGRVAVRVQLIDKQVQPDSGSFVYALPRTALRVGVLVERSVYTPGPYAAYAEKYLGLTGIKNESKTSYYIKSVRCNSYEEADPQQLYMVQLSDNNVRLDFLKMTKDGLMLTAENFAPSARKAVMPGFSRDKNAAISSFTNMGVESMFKDVKKKAAAANDDEDDDEELDAAPSSIFLSAKTIEEKASEAAQFLLTLRKRKFEIITGDIDAVFNSNEAIKVAIKELKQMEQEYLSLFIGKTVLQQASYAYDVVPAAGQNTYPIFKFSEDKGIQEGQGRGIVLEVLPENKYSAIKNAGNDSNFKLRLPDVAQVRLLDDKDELYRGRFLIYQNGKVVSMTVENFVKE